MIKPHPDNFHESITVDRVMAAAEAQMFGTEDDGFCISCGERHMGCEGDARNYKCEYCEEEEVYGAQELMFYLIT